MRFLDWCEQVWAAVGKAYDADPNYAHFGLNLGPIYDELGFGEASRQPGFDQTPAREAIFDALGDLVLMGLVEAEPWLRVVLTNDGRKSRSAALRTSWKQIHRQVELEPAAAAFLAKAIELGEIEDEHFARHKDLVASELFAALGWDWHIGRARGLADDLENEGCLVISARLDEIHLHPTYIALVKMTTQPMRPFRRVEAAAGAPSVFVSYAHEDADAARAIALGLQDEGLGVWFDEGEIRAGDSIVEVVTRGAYETNFLVALVSEDSVDSKWCRKELAVAMTGELSDRGIFVIPLRVGDVLMPPSLSDKKYLRVDAADPEAVVDELAADIRAHASRRPG